MDDGHCARTSNLRSIVFLALLAANEHLLGGGVLGADWPRVQALARLRACAKKRTVGEPNTTLQRLHDAMPGAFGFGERH